MPMCRRRGARARILRIDRSWSIACDAPRLPDPFRDDGCPTPSRHVYCEQAARFPERRRALAEEAGHVDPARAIHPAGGGTTGHAAEHTCRAGRVAGEAMVRRPNRRAEAGRQRGRNVRPPNASARRPLVDLGLLRATVWPEGPDGFKTAILHTVQCNPALPLGLAAYPLVSHARATLTAKAIGVERVMGIATLPGLCHCELSPRRRTSASMRHSNAPPSRRSQPPIRARATRPMLPPRAASKGWPSSMRRWRTSRQSRRRWR
jgi:hypothetical protein